MNWSGSNCRMVRLRVREGDGVAGPIVISEVAVGLSMEAFMVVLL